MFSDDVKNKIEKNILKDMKKYSVKSAQYSDFIDKKLDYEFGKYIDSNHFKLVFYDNDYNYENLNNFNIIIDDFLGKSKALEIKNSYENYRYYKYFKNHKSKNLDLVFKQSINSLVFDIKTLNIINKKSFFSYIFNFIITSFLIIFKILFLFFISVINFLFFLFFLLFKSLLRFKYRFFKNNSFFNFFILFFKHFMDFIKNTFLIFSSFFINNFFSLVDNIKMSNIYSTYNINNKNKIDRYEKSDEQINILSKIRKKRLKELSDYILLNKEYIPNDKFYKVLFKNLNLNSIKNSVLKEYYLGLINSQKLEIKKSIIIGRIEKKLNKFKDKNSLFINRINSINNSLLCIVNKDKKLYKNIIEKINNNFLEI